MKKSKSFCPKPIDEVLVGKDIVLLYFSVCYCTQYDNNDFVGRQCDIATLTLLNTTQCTQCRKVTPIVKKIYQANCGKRIELFFISDDFDREGMLDCMKKSHGDWYAFEHGSRVGERLKKKFSHGFKTLVVLKPDGTIINEVDIDDIEQNPSIIDECKSM